MKTPEALKELLGQCDEVTVSGKLLEQVDCGSYLVESLQLTLNTLETVPGIFAYPKGARKSPLVLFNHSHGGDFLHGKSELFHSAPYLQEPSFGETLLKMGYAVAAIDHFSFGERQGKAENDLVKEFLLTGRTLWGMRLFDSQNFLTYLCQRPEVDTARIATIGMSMGGFMSWWLASLDERIKLCVDIAAQASFERLIAERALSHHGFYLYVPRLLQYFSTAEIQSLIAPRLRLSLSGKGDKLCPVSGVAQLQKDLQAVYVQKQAPENFVSYSLTGGHQETKEMQMLWQQFLQEHL